jgi:alkylhydroperoxidase/carboxymuconolactone decarboxylase family protein YurZ
MHTHVDERNRDKKRLNALMLKSPMRVYRAMGDIGKDVYADGALSKKAKELMALAIAVSQNCFD